MSYFSLSPDVGMSNESHGTDKKNITKPSPLHSIFRMNDNIVFSIAGGGFLSHTHTLCEINRGQTAPLFREISVRGAVDSFGL